MAEDFERIGRTMRGAGAHLTDERATRIKRAALSDKIKLIEYHPDFHCAVVEGEQGAYYHIDEFGRCSCPDFEKRQLPCKFVFSYQMTQPLIGTFAAFGIFSSNGQYSPKFVTNDIC